MPAQIVWGIDIGRSAVKGVKLRRQRGVFEVIAADIVSYEGEPEPGVDFSRDARVWAAIKTFQERNRIGREMTVVAIPGVSTFIRNVTIIPVGGKTPEELIEYEAREHMVLGLDSVVWDNEIFPPRPDRGKQQDGMIFAVKKDSLRNFLLCFETAGIGVDDIQTSPVCLYNLARFDGWIDGPTMIVDIGAQSTDIVIVDGEQYWIRSVSTGGEDITRAIASEFRLPFDKAELVKMNIGQSPRAREILQRIIGPLKGLANEVIQSLTYYQREVGAIDLKRLVLLGGGSKMLGVKKLLGEGAPADLYPITGLHNVAAAEDEATKEFRSDPGVYAVAVGAALQAAGQATAKISLIPHKAAAKTFVSRKKPFVVATLVLAFLLLAGMFGFGKYEEMRLNRLTAEADKTLQIVDRYFAQLKAAKDTQAIIKAIDDLAKIGEKRNLWLYGLKVITPSIPDNGGRGPRNKKLWLISLKAGIEQKKIEIQPPPPKKGAKSSKKPKPIVHYVEEANVYLTGGVNAIGSESAILNFVRGQLSDAMAYSPIFQNVRIVGAEQSDFLAPSKESDALPPEGRYLIFTISAQMPLDKPVEELIRQSEEKKSAKP